MRLINFILYFIFLILLPSVSAVYFGGRYFDLNPYTFLENEWIVFFGVFLIVFALVYIALNNTFGERKKSSNMWVPPWVAQPAAPHYKGAIVVISLVVAFFTASVFVQRGWIDNYFSEAIAGWMLLLVLAVMVILSIPFYKALKTNIGGGPAVAVTLLIIWGILRYFININNLLPYDTNISPEFYQLYEFIISGWFLAVAVVIGVLFTVIKSSLKK